MTLIFIALLLIAGGLGTIAFVFQRFFHMILSILKIEEPTVAPLFVRPVKKAENRMYKRTRNLRRAGE